MNSARISTSAYAFFALISFFVINAHVQLAGYAADDAYLHFRIAENFISVGVPYFNVNEAVLATSSPIWTLLLSVVFAFTGNLLIAVPVLNGVIVSACALVFTELAVLLCGRSSPLLIIGTMILSVSGLLGSGLQLMETPLALFLFGLGLLHYFRGSPLGFVWLTLACFTRLECLVFLGLVYLENLTFRRVAMGKALIATVLSAFPLVTFLLYFFGTLIPQTVVAKAAVYSLKSSEFMTLVAATYFGKFIFYNFPLVVLAFFTIFTILSIYLFLMHLHPPEYVVRDRRSLVLVCSGLMVFLGYLVSRIYLFPWYSPLFITPVLVGLFFFAWNRSSLPLRLITVLISLPPLFVAVRDLCAGIVSPELFSEYEGGRRARAYREAGAFIARDCPECLVMAAEIGGLGYAFRGKIRDAAGLASPEAVQYHTPAMARRNLGGGVPSGYVRAAQPDIIVGLESYLTDLRAHGTLNHYSNVPFNTTLLNADDTLRIFRKRDTAKPID